MSSNHCVSDFRHIPRIVPAPPWTQRDNDNSATFVILLNTNPISPGSLSVTRNITDGLI